MKKLNITMQEYEVILGLIYLAAQLLLIPSILLTVNYLLAYPMSDAELNFVNFAVNFICVTVIFHKYLIDCTRTAFANIKHVLCFVGMGLVLYLAGNSIIYMLILNIDETFSNVNDSSIYGLLNQNRALIIIGTVVLVPIVEEVLYRGVLFAQLYKRSPIVGYIVSVLVFAAIHVVSYINSCTPMHLLLCFLQYLPASIVLAWTYAQTGTIWTPVLIHMTINLIGILSMLAV